MAEYHAYESDDGNMVVIGTHDILLARCLLRDSAKRDGWLEAYEENNTRDTLKELEPDKKYVAYTGGENIRLVDEPTNAATTPALIWMF